MSSSCKLSDKPSGCCSLASNQVRKYDSKIVQVIDEDRHREMAVRNKDTGQFNLNALVIVYRNYDCNYLIKRW